MVPHDINELPEELPKRLNQGYKPPFPTDFQKHIQTLTKKQLTQESGKKVVNPSIRSILEKCETDAHDLSRMTFTTSTFMNPKTFGREQFNPAHQTTVTSAEESKETVLTSIVSTNILILFTLVVIAFAFILGIVMWIAVPIAILAWVRMFYFYLIRKN